jgi:hypothetical protein
LTIRQLFHLCPDLARRARGSIPAISEVENAARDLPRASRFAAEIELPRLIASLNFDRTNRAVDFLPR